MVYRDFGSIYFQRAGYLYYLYDSDTGAERGADRRFSSESADYGGGSHLCHRECNTGALYLIIYSPDL